ncbi:MULTISPECIES: PadR family transcriptional regulator [Brevundimonas]|uniref:PadR family transcriptional regulator n=1 Tax=Brevundimonas TaxID=41275 RepID=UPI000F013061|nr:PadR family transcriptional regulator [Brevundimonas lutea]
MPEIIETQLKKGVLSLCVLALLARGDSYAYEIASRLAEGVDMGEGTIYPLMRRLQSDGLVETYLVESSAGPSRKYYRLTQAGRDSLARQSADWTAFARAVDAIVDAPLPDPATADAAAAAPQHEARS